MSRIPVEINAKLYFGNSPNRGYSKESIQRFLNNRRTRMRSMLQSKYLGFRVEEYNRKTTLTIEHWRYILGYISKVSNVYERDSNDDRFVSRFRIEHAENNPLRILLLLKSETVTSESFTQRRFNVGNDHVVIQRTRAYASIWFNNERIYNYFPDKSFDSPLGKFSADDFSDELLGIFRVILKTLLVETEYMLDNLDGLFKNTIYMTPELWEQEKAHRLYELSDE